MNPQSAFGFFGFLALIGGVVLGAAAHILNWGVSVMAAEERKRVFDAGPDIHETTELWETYPEAQA